MNTTPEDSPVLKSIQSEHNALLQRAREEGLSADLAAAMEANRASLFHQMLFTDGRFDLPNTVAFYRLAEQLIANGKSSLYGCMAFNIQNFRKVNKVLGSEKSNEVLSAYLNGISAMLWEDEYLCSGGQDNGIILCKKEHIDTILDYLHSTRIEINQETHETIEVRSAVGCNPDISGIPLHFMVMDTVSLPLKIARQNKSRAQWCIFWNERLEKQSIEQAQIESLIPKALELQEFQVYYQPKVNLKNYVLSGAEALCRWPHDGKMIFPDQFIPLMERNGTIGELDFYMLAHTCSDIRRWIDAGLSPVQISVNLSRVNMQSESLLERIINTVDAYQVPHTYIQIELTETTTDVGFEELKELMEGLRNAGFSMAIDDFGTGYSSMSIIRNLPWNVIKIDKSLLHEHTDPKQDKHLMFRAIAHMVHTLGLETIVEGVETLQDINLLKENDCYLAQGYFFDKPLSAAEFETRLTTMQG